MNIIFFFLVAAIEELCIKISNSDMSVLMPMML
jgi:hypothetical protein